jgi:hypothetical protein
MISLILAVLLHGIPLPRGAKVVEDRAVSSKSFRDTVDYIHKYVDKQGVASHEVGPYRARGVDITRFVSDDPATGWLAIHVYRQAGKTWISVVPRPS